MHCMFGTQPVWDCLHTGKVCQIEQLLAETCEHAEGFKMRRWWHRNLHLCVVQRGWTTVCHMLRQCNRLLQH